MSINQALNIVNQGVNGIRSEISRLSNRLSSRVSQISLLRAEEGVSALTQQPLLSVHSTYLCTAVGVIVACGFVLSVGFVMMQKRIMEAEHL